MAQTDFAVRALEGTPQSVGVGRSLLRTSLLAQQNGHASAPLDPEKLFEVELVTAELLTNAVKHAGGPLLLAWARTAETVFIAVFDRRGDLPPCVREAGPEATGGRGLALVQQLSRSWGWSPTVRGKRCWAAIEVRTEIQSNDEVRNELSQEEVEAFVRYIGCAPIDWEGNAKCLVTLAFRRQALPSRLLGGR